MNLKLLLLVGALGLGAEPTTNTNPWDKVNETDGITIWARPVPSSRVREVKAQTIIPTPWRRIVEVITDLPHYVEFMPYVVELEILGHDDGTTYMYQRIDPPFVSERDYTLKSTIQSDGSNGTWILTWTIAPDRGPPPRDGVVRLSVCEGSWTVKDLGNGQADVTYWLHTDPGGSIPAWIANKANTMSLPDLLSAVRNRASDPKWKRR